MEARLVVLVAIGLGILVLAHAHRCVPAPRAVGSARNAHPEFGDLVSRLRPDHPRLFLNSEMWPGMRERALGEGSARTGLLPASHSGLGYGCADNGCKRGERDGEPDPSCVHRWNSHAHCEPEQGGRYWRTHTDPGRGGARGGSRSHAWDHAPGGSGARQVIHIGPAWDNKEGGDRDDQGGSMAATDDKR